MKSSIQRNYIGQFMKAKNWIAYMTFELSTTLPLGVENMLQYHSIEEKYNNSTQIIIYYHV